MCSSVQYTRAAVITILKDKSEGEEIAYVATVAQPPCKSTWMNDECDARTAQFNTTEKAVELYNNVGVAHSTVPVTDSETGLSTGAVVGIVLGITFTIIIAYGIQVLVLHK